MATRGSFFNSEEIEISKQDNQVDFSVKVFNKYDDHSAVTIKLGEQEIEELCIWFVRHIHPVRAKSVLEAATQSALTSPMSAYQPSVGLGER